MGRLPLRILWCVLAGLLACGVSLWPLAYRDVSMSERPNPITWLLLGAGAGMLGGYLIRENLRTPWLSVAAGFVLAVIGRVVVETAQDPTSHNLWPFEVAIAGGFGLVASFAGVMVARIVQRGEKGRS